MSLPTGATGSRSIFFGTMSSWSGSQTITRPAGNRTIIHHFPAFLCSCAHPRVTRTLLLFLFFLRASPRTRRARPNTSTPTDLSHFPLLRDAGVMKRASLTCVFRLENLSLNSQEIHEHSPINLHEIQCARGSNLERDRRIRNGEGQLGLYKRCKREREKEKYSFFFVDVKLFFASLLLISSTYFFSLPVAINIVW